MIQLIESNMKDSHIPTFSITAMMRESPDVVRRFLDFYRAAGAEKIFVYFDGPTDTLEGLDLTRTELIECDDAFWQATCGDRPKTLSAALWVTHTRSAGRHNSDWLFITDADEFLTGGSISTMLAQVPTDVEALRIRNVEAVWGPGDDIDKPFTSTHFRKPLPKKLFALLARPLYGRLAPFFHSGLVGHSEGKHFLRRGTPVSEIQSHDSFRDGTRLGRWAHEVVPGAEQMVVLHFDAVSFERWREKWRRRFSKEMPSNTMSPKRASQLPRIEAAVNAGDPEALQLFRDFYGLTRWQKTILSLIGGLERHRDIF